MRPLLALVGDLASTAALRRWVSLQTRQRDGITAIAARPVGTHVHACQRRLDVADLGNVAVDVGETDIHEQVRYRFVPRVVHLSGKVLVVFLVRLNELRVDLVAQLVESRSKLLSECVNLSTG